MNWREDLLTHYYIHVQKSRIIKILKDKYTKVQNNKDLKDKYDFNTIINSLTFKK